MLLLAMLQMAANSDDANRRLLIMAVVGTLSVSIGAGVIWAVVRSARKGRTLSKDVSEDVVHADADGGGAHGTADCGSADAGCDAGGGGDGGGGGGGE